MTSFPRAGWQERCCISAGPTASGPKARKSWPQVIAPRAPSPGVAALSSSSCDSATPQRLPPASSLVSLTLCVSDAVSPRRHQLGSRQLGARWARSGLSRAKSRAPRGARRVTGPVKAELPAGQVALPSGARACAGHGWSQALSLCVSFFLTHTHMHKHDLNKSRMWCHGIQAPRPHVKTLLPPASEYHYCFLLMKEGDSGLEPKNRAFLFLTPVHKLNHSWKAGRKSALFLHHSCHRAWVAMRNCHQLLGLNSYPESILGKSLPSHPPNSH